MTHTFRRRRVVFDELRVEIADNGAPEFEFEFAVGADEGRMLARFEVASDKASALAFDLLTAAGCKRAKRVAQQILRWAKIVEEEERKDRAE